MVRRFYSKPLPFFGTVAMLLLCIVVFFLPFAGRGAKLAVESIVNNVADWLPAHYQETKELEEFKKYFFGGGQFVVVSGPWCKEGNSNFERYRRRIYEESLEYEKELEAQGRLEEIRAHRLGDELGLMYAGSWHENWGEQNERWLQGRNKQWYFINQKGNLYRWDGQNNIYEGFQLWLEKMRNGKNKATGTYISQFGTRSSGQGDDQENEFYQDPLKLCCRPFNTVISGPDVFEQMAGPDGSLRLTDMGESDKSTFDAKIEAHNRLTGALFGPTPQPDFDWTFESLLRKVSSQKLELLRSRELYQTRFNEFMKQKIEEEFDGNRQALLDAPAETKLRLWYELFYQLDVEAPARQTCLVVTLNEPVMEEFARVVGRPLMGKPRGRLLELAIGRSGISAENLHIGGPPSDNVAIDEEGTITLRNLVGLSAMIGIVLAYLSFRNVRVTVMLFFTGGVGAMASLAYVWFGGANMDAILMSMPSLIYVLGLSGAVHIVNYYRDACHEHGHKLAAETAIGHSWFPCLLAAFTTALGLGSLMTSNLAPIYKFGKFSAIATLATVILLFTFLPAALVVFKPGYHKLSQAQREEKDKGGGLSAIVTRFWDRIGGFVIRNYTGFAVVGVFLIFAGGWGVWSRIQTQVHLLKMFDPGAKVLVDYRWMEENLGELVPAEIVVSIAREHQQEVYRESLEQRQRLAIKQAASGQSSMDGFEDEFNDLGDRSGSLGGRGTLAASEGEQAADEEADDEGSDEPALEMTDGQRKNYDLRLSMLERIELSNRVRHFLELYFGDEGLGIVGSGMSTDVFVPLNEFTSTDEFARKVFSGQLYKHRPEMLEQEYLAIGDEGKIIPEEQLQGRELWRISIRLAALSDVDYGRFINDMKSVVEPINSAYRHRDEVFRKIFASHPGRPLREASILVLGGKPEFSPEDLDIKAKLSQLDASESPIDQTLIFSDTLRKLFTDRGLGNRNRNSRGFLWIDPDRYSLDNPELTDKERLSLQKFFKPESWRSRISGADCVVLVEDDPMFDVEFIKANATNFVDCRDHRFLIDPETKTPFPGMLTATEREIAGETIGIKTIYTGIIPIVYKAQRALLQSLIESIVLAFVMITAVMMLLLRDWSRPFGKGNWLNVRGGLLAMIPNVFPVVFVFGIMAYRGIKVDIGSMMTASVAMGVAVDDTIHFLNWYRSALAKGLDRIDAIKMAYSRVATAMTQTTLIAGLGLSAFSMSTFTPTQKFGTLMLFLLAAALIGDLIILPAILASPLGKYFSKTLPKDPVVDTDASSPSHVALDEATEISDSDGSATGNRPARNFRLIGDEGLPDDSKTG